MSAAIVRNHVVEGLKLAAEAKLPECVRRFIAEHHGTQPISFFYDRARELDPEAELDPAAFSYPGPKPQSKETAIAMLADSVESAARVLQDPTPERIEALVERIVSSKVAQGQLDEAPLTLNELKRIKQQLASVLAGLYHQRIDYPSTRQTTAAPAEPEPVAVPPGPAPHHGRPACRPASRPASRPRCSARVDPPRFLDAASSVCSAVLRSPRSRPKASRGRNSRSPCSPTPPSPS